MTALSSTRSSMPVRPARTILPRGRATKFTGITLEQPEHGKVVKAGVNRFVYRPDKGFTGKDAYMFKICATKGKQKGCSAVAFVPEVR